ncbi:MAG: cyclophilin-like fold protein [Archaeoglobaceae archaeon]|nr:cyclophilin-like fold protein [Archaeoglobaceae archaeon]MDW8128247.1 cyclophilin-like fold protein [Archaeoglobaceae archaeon]
MKLKFKFESVECIVELYEKIAPQTVKAIAKALPIESTANRWGDEIYFETNIECRVLENSKEVVEIGDVAYWIPGKAICLFFGKTPISDDKIRPASAVNVVGRILGDPFKLKAVRDGEKVFVEIIK